MSSVGQAIGGVVGGVIGFFVGGPTGALYGAQLGMGIGGAIDPPKGPNINGPRLDDLNVQTSTYGAFIPRNYGTMAQTGNVFWLQGDRLTEVETVTESGGKGGPVSTTTTWSYYATFAVGLCQGPIDGVRRIWIGGQLWYDAGSDDLATIIASNQNAGQFTLYLGTDTQTADPLIQADKGVANVPAYRGLAYLVFDTLPLEKYGNSLAGAQVKVEIVKTGTSSYVLQEYGSASTGIFPGRGIAISNNHALIVNYSSNTLQSFSLGTYKPVKVGEVNALTSPVGIAVSGNHAYVVGGANTFRVFDVSDPNHPTLESTFTTLGFEDDIVLNGDYAYVTSQATDSVRTYAINPSVKHIHTIPTGVDPKRMAVDGDYLYVCCENSAEIQIFNIGDGIPVLSTSFSTDAGPRDVVIQDGYAYVVCSTANTLQIFDVSNPLSVPAAVGSIASAVAPISVAVDDGYAYVVTRNNNQLQVFAVNSPAAPTLVGLIVIAANPNAVTFHDGMIYVAGDSATIKSYLFADKQIAETSVQLSDIVQAECLLSNLLDVADLDVSELTDSVRGYRIAQLGAIRGALDPLRAAWPFDVVQHGYQIKFRRRGSASVATIQVGALDARAAGEAPGVQVTDVREIDLMLPRRVSVNYVDVTREYDTNQQYYEHLNTDAVSERAVDLPIVFNADEAARTAETLAYLYWLERYDVGPIRLPPEYSYLEPADVITIVGDGATWELRLISINTLPDGRVECRAKYNKAAIYVPVAVGSEGQSTGATLTLAGPCVYSLLDIPLLRDDDDTAGFPVAMAGYLSGWPGGVLYRSDDGGQTWADLQAFGPGAVIGYATGTLAAHGGTMYDLASTLAVRLYAGTLASVTETQLFAGQNWFAYGAHGRWEIIAARKAVLQADGSYVLSDFLRGQHGTEWATGLHAANDRIVLLDATELAFISVNSSTIGTARDYRAITTGKALDSDASLAFTYTGVNLECLSPVHLSGNRLPTTNDWTLTWTRRSRFAGWRDYVDAALGEASESYEVDVFSDGTYATLKRTLTSGTPTVAYTSAQQVADFGSNQATLYLKIYQLSATVGRGYALTQSITR